MLPMKPALIVDNDLAYLESLSQHPASARMRPVVANGLQEAQAMIADASVVYSGIFINLAFRAQDVIMLIRFCHTNKIGIPIVLMYESATPPLTRRIVDRLAVHDLVKKPFGYDELVAIIEPVVKGFDGDGAVASVADNLQAGEMASVQDSEFTPIMAGNFISGKRSFFDLYVKIGENRFLKILRSGDTFTPERIESYLKKGVKHFFLRKDAQSTYLGYCDHLTEALLNSKLVPTKVKANQVLNLGQETIGFMSARGVSDKTIRHAIEYSVMVKNLVHQPEFRAVDTVRDFVDDLASYEHGVATAIVASLMLRTEWKPAERLYRVVSLAGMFHDIALKDVLPQESEDDPALLKTPQERELLNNHPLKSAEIMSKVKGMDPAVCEVIAQHHERRCGKGYPNRYSLGHILPLTEVVAISDEFVRRLARVARGEKFDPILDMMNTVFGHFSYDVVKKFLRVFNS